MVLIFLENGLLLIFAFSNNIFFPHAQSFCPRCEEQIVGFEPQLLHTDIIEKSYEFIDRPLRNESENKDTNEVIEN